MQVHASSGAALRAVHATPPAWRCCLMVQKSHMPVSVRARARSHTSQILRPVRGRGLPLVPALSQQPQLGVDVVTGAHVAESKSAE
jgi:hypothetical protein